ncbi:hypothetical protein PVAP13_5KG085961, partial [Panicum virgatum]
RRDKRAKRNVVQSNPRPHRNSSPPPPPTRRLPPGGRRPSSIHPTGRDAEPLPKRSRPTRRRRRARQWQRATSTSSPSSPWLSTSTTRWISSTGRRAREEAAAEADTWSITPAATTRH